MTIDFARLTQNQLDLLKEIGNVGVGHAATALSHLLNRRIHMTVPKIAILPFKEVEEAVGGGDSLVAGVYLQVSGAAPSSILLVLPAKSASLLIDILMGRELGATRHLGEMEQSALREIGNILASAYLNALEHFTSIKFTPSVPSLAVDMAGAIVSEILSKLGQMGDYALLIETDFLEDAKQINGHFFLLPEPGSLEQILQALSWKE